MFYSTNGLLNSKYKRNESNNLYEHPTLGMHRVYAIFCMNHQAYGWLLVLFFMASLVTPVWCLCKEAGIYIKTHDIWQTLQIQFDYGHDDTIHKELSSILE
mmetsp:Transcript_29478/g.43074  ORF Transcript_29478/g.43074 Transcript_29478/m.43074 type:complete len:101 (+) Transcript_29478:1467-1769(+)